MDWLDIVIIIALLAFSAFGFKDGFIMGIIELAGIIISLALPFIFYTTIGHILEEWGISRLYSGAAAFIIIWLITIMIYFGVMRRLYKRVPSTVRFSVINRVLGVLTGGIRGLIIIAMLVTLAAVIPNRVLSQKVIDNSILARPMLNVTMDVSAKATDIFGPAVHEALGFLTIHPSSDEKIDLHFKDPHPVIDPSAEEKMLVLVNKERTGRGLKPLVMDRTIRKVARAHSVDMLKNGYFAHVSIDGRTPFQRMKQGGVRYITAGENLAYAPTVEIAHAGLMKSPGHRANILNPAFRRVGIGVARGGKYRAAFTQDFAN